MLRTAAEVWLVVQVLQLHSSAAGPGTSVALLLTAPNNIAEVVNRTCFDLRTLVTGLWGIVTLHWPRLFATKREALLDYGIDSQMSQGMVWSGALLATAMLLAVVRIATRLLSERRWDRRYDFCAYLTLVGACSVGGFVVLRCGEVALMRYELLSLLGAVGVAGWYLRVERSRPVFLAWIALIACWMIVVTVPHARLWTEYLRHPPFGAKRLIIRHLDARGIHYGRADYWNAYYISFLTDERIVLAANDFPRIVTYESIVQAHAKEAVRISRRRCDDGQEIIPGIFLCPQ
jgi:hypothetical protein